MQHDVTRAEAALAPAVAAGTASFVAADMCRADFGQADAVVILDVLHYVPIEAQDDELRRWARELLAITSRNLILAVSGILCVSILAFFVSFSGIYGLQTTSLSLLTLVPCLVALRLPAQERTSLGDLADLLAAEDRREFEAGLMGRTENDSREDFADVYDFAEAFPLTAVSKRRAGK